MSALLVWLCLTLHQGLLRAGATWLFDLPKKRGPSARPSPLTGGHATEFPTAHAQSVSDPVGPTITRQASPPDTERV
jgi:hypothetical protein